MFTYSICFMEKSVRKKQLYYYFSDLELSKSCYFHHIVCEMRTGLVTKQTKIDLCRYIMLKIINKLICLFKNCKSLKFTLLK